MSNVHGGAIGQSYFRSLIRLVYIIDPCYTVIRKSNTRKVLVIFSKPCDKVIKWWEIFQTFVKKICWKTNFIIFQLNFSIFSFEFIFSKWSKNLKKKFKWRIFFFVFLQFYLSIVFPKGRFLGTGGVRRIVRKFVAGKP